MKERSVTADITDALFELLKTKELPQITVTELIKNAGVCRASFYRNFYLTEDVMLSGDTLFCGSIGRTDLGGDPAQMKESLRRLKVLPKNYRVYTGHDYSTTLDEERMSNPYMRNL